MLRTAYFGYGAAYVDSVFIRHADSTAPNPSASYLLQEEDVFEPDYEEEYPQVEEFPSTFEDHEFLAWVADGLPISSPCRDTPTRETCCIKGTIVTPNSRGPFPYEHPQKGLQTSSQSAEISISKGTPG